MKKNLCSAIALSLFFCLNGSALAQSYDYTTAFRAEKKNNRYSLSVKISANGENLAKSGYAVIGLYGEQKELLQTYSTQLTATATEAQEFSLTTNMPAGKTVAEVRAFLWNSGSEMTPLAETVTVSFKEDIEAIVLDASLLDSSDYAFTDGSRIYFCAYPSAASAQPTRYILGDSYEKISLYVNDTPVPVTEEALLKYVLQCPIGRVTLKDSDENGTYERIETETYVTAVVDSVNLSNNSVSFLQTFGDIRQYQLFFSQNVQGTFELDNTEITLADLRENDILSIAYNVNLGADDSDFYKIYVSHDTAEGVFGSVNYAEETFQIGSFEYPSVSFPEMECSLLLGYQYRVRLDHFGRIVLAEEL